jgi:hypothetical protein
VARQGQGLLDDLVLTLARIREEKSHPPIVRVLFNNPSKPQGIHNMTGSAFYFDVCTQINTINVQYSTSNPTHIFT